MLEGPKCCQTDASKVKRRDKVSYIKEDGEVLMTLRRRSANLRQILSHAIWKCQGRISLTI